MSRESVRNAVENRSFSAANRNSIQGIVKAITPGTVNAEVVLEIAPGVEITSVITRASAERLGLRVGLTAYAVIKASDVMMGIGD